MIKKRPKISVKLDYLGDQANCWQCGRHLPAPYFLVGWKESLHSEEGVNICNVLCLISRLKDWKTETPESLKARPSRTPNRNQKMEH